MTKMLIDIDDVALAEASALLGTTTKKETVNSALRETVHRLRRVQAFQRLIEMRGRGDFDDLVASPDGDARS